MIELVLEGLKAAFEPLQVYFGQKRTRRSSVLKSAAWEWISGRSI